MTSDMRRDFSSRDELVSYLREQFPSAAAIDNHIGDIRGGRKAAELALSQVNPKLYGHTRNALDGAVTRLSPYIRHGVLNLNEVRDYALKQAHTLKEAESLIRELGFRDYFQHVYEAIGEGIWQDQEDSKTGYPPSAYSSTLPPDIHDASTGMACIDTFSKQLRESGCLHNHARLWLAAYIIHWRRVQWQTGASWFLTHLLDGDPASNNLSWQWVAGTFSSKPYFFNRENLEKYTGGVYCQVCPLKGNCDFEGDYTTLETRLFPQKNQRMEAKPAPKTWTAHEPNTPQNQLRRPVIWIHGNNLSPYQPSLKKYPSTHAIWVWDDDLLRTRKISLKRIVFIYECLLDLPVTIRRGQVPVVVNEFADAQNADGIVTSYSNAPRFRQIQERLWENRTIEALDPQPFIQYKGPLELKRFSHYWKTAETYAFQVTTD
jgi:deoxyribodipyrimidine photo-lyase